MRLSSSSVSRGASASPSRYQSKCCTGGLSVTPRARVVSTWASVRAQGAQFDALAGGFLGVGHRVARHAAPEAVGERVGCDAGATHRRRVVSLKDDRLAVGQGDARAKRGAPSVDCHSPLKLTCCLSALGSRSAVVIVSLRASTLTFCMRFLSVMGAQEEPDGPPRRAALTSRYPATTRPAKARPSSHARQPRFDPLACHP